MYSGSHLLKLLTQLEPRGYFFLLGLGFRVRIRVKVRDSG